MIRSSFSSPTGLSPCCNGARALHLAGKTMRPHSQPTKAPDRPHTHTMCPSNHPRFSPHPGTLRTAQRNKTATGRHYEKKTCDTSVPQRRLHPFTR